MKAFKFSAALFLAAGAFFSGTLPVSQVSETDMIDEAITAMAEETSYDYAKYSKQSLEELQKTVTDKKESAQGDDVLVYRKWEQEIDKALQKADDSGENIDSVYALQERAHYEAETVTSTDASQSQFVEDAKADVERYEQQIRQQEEEKKKEEEKKAEQKRVEDNTIWAESFLSVFTGKTENGHSVENGLTGIDIYAFFEDGQYRAPTDKPSLSRIAQHYCPELEGMRIQMNRNESIFSPANGGTVRLDDKALIIEYSNGAAVRYENIHPAVKDGQSVSLGDKVGSYEKTENQEGLIVSLSVEGQSVPCEWMMTEMPFIPGKGMSMPLYLQNDPLWKDNAYGQSDIGEAGCGPCAMAMAFSYLKQQIITPADVVEKMGGADSAYWTWEGSLWSSIDEVTGAYGLQVRRISSGKVGEALKNNHPVISIMGPGTFTNGGHFICLSGLDEDGNILVNDSFDDSKKKHYSSSYSIELIAQENSGCFWEIMPAE